jgi:hypothetical protein
VPVGATGLPSAAICDALAFRMGSTDPTLVHLVSILLPAAIFVLAVGLAVFAAGQPVRQTAQNLAVLARHLRLKLVEPPPKWGLWAQRASVEGEFRGKAVRFYTFTTGTGKNRRYWCAASVHVANASGLILDLRVNPVADASSSLLEVATGETTFDDAFALRSNAPADAVAALSPEVRRDLLAARQRGVGGSFMAYHHEVRYVESGSFANATRTERVASMLPVVCALADGIEQDRQC